MNYELYIMIWTQKYSSLRENIFVRYLKQHLYPGASPQTIISPLITKK